jgi:pyruvate dehydrogenase E2 component (dihydrolipoamide acetyltransferase)
MAEVIRMPLLSDTMTEGKIVAWNKKVGDKVKADDVLADVETDKATMEINGYVDGTLLYIGVEAGKAAEVNGIICIIGKEGEEYKHLLDGEAVGSGQGAVGKGQEAVGSVQGVVSSVQEAVGSVQEAVGSGQEVVTKLETKVSLPAGAKEIRMPLLSDTMTEGKIVVWNKKVGDLVKADDAIADVETDKATMEVVGYEEGTLLYIGVEAGKAAQINEIIAIVGKPGTDVSAYIAYEKSKGANGSGQVATANEAQETVETPASNEPSTLNLQSSTENGRIKASPLAKKIAAEKGLDISKVAGTGDGGRITKKDIDGYKESASNGQVAVGSEQLAVSSGQVTSEISTTTNNKQQTTNNFQPSTTESYTDVPLTQMRKVIARRLGESMFTAPHFYLTMELNMDNAMAARTAINEVSPVKVSFNDMIIKACASALRLHPDVNSSWHGDFIRKNNHIHIGSALALPEGLIVPVIRFADQKTLSQIAADAKELYGKAKDKKLQPAEFSGNTFTISNLGMMDIEEFTAIINPPDSCILAVGKIKEIVVSRNGQFVATNVMKVTLSCDHRSVDGAVGAAFLQTLKKFVENPVTMLV